MSWAFKYAGNYAVNLPELFALAKKATPGPWARIIDPNSEFGIYPDVPHGKFLAKVDNSFNTDTIIGAVNALPALEKMVEGLNAHEQKWAEIAENGEGTPMTDSFQFRCGMERCAAELRAILEQVGVKEPK